MKSNKQKLIESAVRKIVNKVMKEAYQDDDDAREELIMYAENDSRLYDVLMKTYLPALQKFVKRGTFDREKALKLMEYYYSNYARPGYKREFGDDIALSKSDRRKFAEYFLNYLIDEQYLEVSA